MTKRSNLQARPADTSERAALPGKTEKMIAIVDHCTAAQTLADSLGNRFLAYLLAMTIQEARTGLRRDDELADGFTADLPPNT